MLIRKDYRRLVLTLVALCLFKIAVALMIVDVGMSFFFGDLRSVHNWTEQAIASSDNAEVPFSTADMMTTQYFLGSGIIGGGALVLVLNVAMATAVWRRHMKRQPISKPIVHTCIALDLGIAILFCGLLGGGVYLAVDVHRFPEDNLGFMDRYTDSFLLTAALLANRSAESIGDEEGGIGSVHKTIKCCGFFSPHDFWLNKREIRLKQPPTNGLWTGVRVTDDWLFACALNRTEETEVFCYAPVSCCRPRSRQEEVDDDYSITCNAASLMLETSKQSHVQRLHERKRPSRRDGEVRAAQAANMYDIGCVPALIKAVARRLWLFSIDAALIVVCCLLSIVRLLPNYRRLFNAAAPAQSPIIAEQKSKVN